MYRNWTNSLVFFLAAPSSMLLGIETAALRSCAVRPNCSRAGKFSSSLYKSTTKSIPACQTLSFRCGLPSLFTTHVSFPDHPGASQIVVPASLLTAPQNPQEPQQEGRKTNHGEPAQKSSPIRHSALFWSHHSKSQQPLPDSLSFDTMKNHKIGCCQTDPCPRKQHKKWRGTLP